MITFAISSDNNISAFDTPDQAHDALALGGRAFASEKELGQLAKEWPASRLVETWNSFAGTAGFDDLRPVRKFTDRKTAVARIWQAVQRLAPAADGGAQGAPEVGTSNKEARSWKKPARGQKRAKGAKVQKKPAAREGSKSSIILDMIAKGATLNELMTAAGWQAHSVRGYLSTAVKKQGLTIESSRTKDGERFYRVAK